MQLVRLDRRRQTFPSQVNIKQARAIGDALRWVGFIESRPSPQCDWTFRWQMEHGSAILPSDYLNSLLWETPDNAARELCRFILRWVPYYHEKGGREGWHAMRRETSKRRRNFYPGDWGSFITWTVEQMQSNGAHN